MRGFRLTSNFGIKGAAVAGFLNAKDPFNPGHDLVRGRIRWFVEVDDSVANVVIDRTLQGRVAGRNGGVVASSYEQFVIVLQISVRESE